MNRPGTAMANRVTLWMLACIPCADCVLNQANNAFHLTLGPLSLLQAFRGVMVLAFVVLCSWRLLTFAPAARQVPLPAVLAFVMLAMVASAELLTTGSLAMESVVPYLQMTYWLLCWTLFSLVCNDQRQADLMLKGLAAGAVLTAVSVFAGFFLGGLNFYADDSVRSSAGWFDTAKMITGDLVTGGICLLYLGRKKRTMRYAFLPLVCFSACIATYARAGAVALIAVVLWLAFWWWFLGRGQSRQWLTRFFKLALATVIVVPFVVPPQTLFARWSDLGDSDQAGSGRATFWKDALDIYAEGTPQQQVFGHGYAAMSASLLDFYGYDIKHTHNDSLDMLLVGGIAGAVWLLCLIGGMVSRVLRLDLRSHESAAAVAILITYVCHSQLTGQIWGTDAMAYYMLSLTGISAVAARRTTLAEPTLNNTAGLRTASA